MAVALAPLSDGAPSMSNQRACKFYIAMQFDVWMIAPERTSTAGDHRIAAHGRGLNEMIAWSFDRGL